MAHDDISQQTLIEHEMLKHITDALRLALGWKQEGGDAARKLSTVRFITRSLQRHLDHLWGLEERDGYMDAVLTLSPHLSKRVNALKGEHEEFRRTVPGIVDRLEQVSSTDQTALAAVWDELLALLQKLDEHSRKETGLLLESFGTEGGGEG
jgi:hemerythrin-like domain-containing protein